MDLREQAIKRIEKKELSTIDIMCAFDIIGADYLGGEICYCNNFNGFCELISDFELEPNIILDYMIGNDNYFMSDMFIVFDGEVLASLEDTEYFEMMLKDKMNGECAEYIMGC